MSNVKKASDEDLIASYKKNESVWKVAKEFGMCGQTVYERLKKIGIKFKGQKFSEHEIKRIIEVYSQEDSLERGDGKLDILCAELGRIKPSISRMARKLGLSNIKRKCSKEHNKTVSERMKIQWDVIPHPRGMLGKRHKKETRDLFSKIVKERWKNMDEESRNAYSLRFSKIAPNTFLNREKASWKCGWRTIGGVKKYYRSRWEANYARYLEMMRLSEVISSWEHEPQRFLFENAKRGCMSYLPDFKVIKPNGTIEFHEVKGWMDDRSMAILRNMQICYPEIKIVLISSKEYLQLNKDYKDKIKDWE